jgi:hypothetical protein
MQSGRQYSDSVAEGKLRQLVHANHDRQAHPTAGHYAHLVVSGLNLSLGRDVERRLVVGRTGLQILLRGERQQQLRGGPQLIPADNERGRTAKLQAAEVEIGKGGLASAKG